MILVESCKKVIAFDRPRGFLRRANWVEQSEPHPSVIWHLTLYARLVTVDLIKVTNAKQFVTCPLNINLIVNYVWVNR